MFFEVTYLGLWLWTRDIWERVSMGSENDLCPSSCFRCLGGISASGDVLFNVAKECAAVMADGGSSISRPDRTSTDPSCFVCFGGEESL